MILKQSICANFRLLLRRMGLDISYTNNELRELFRRGRNALRNQQQINGSNGENGARFNINLNESINIVSIPPLDIDLKNTAAVRKYLKEHFKGREVTIKSDGKLVLFVDQGLQDALKRKNEHRKSFSALDKIIEDSVFIAYENVDARHSNKRPDLKGQFIYASLIDIANEKYIATIKLDDSQTDKRAYFKDISIKKWSLYVGQTENQNANPSADHYLTIQQFINFVKPIFEKNQKKLRFSLKNGENAPQGNEDTDNGVRFSIAPQVDTPEFKNWFKDSKVVDENGEPLIVYHGTNADFNVFDTEKFGAWFSKSMEYAESMMEEKGS